MYNSFSCSLIDGYAEDGGMLSLFWNRPRVSADGLAVFLDTGVDILAEKFPKVSNFKLQ